MERNLRVEGTFMCGGGIHVWELFTCGEAFTCGEEFMCGGDIHVWELFTCGEAFTCGGDIHVWRGHSHVGAIHVWRGHSCVGAIHMWRGIISRSEEFHFGGWSCREM